MIGYIKGYDLKQVSKRMVGKEVFGSSMAFLISSDILKEQVLTALRGGGRVYALYKKKDMVACYIFAKTELAAEQTSELPSTQNKQLHLVQDYMLPEHAQVMDEFEEVLKTELKEVLTWCDIREIYFRDIRLTKEESNGSRIAFGLMIGMALGNCFGLLFHNWSLGICLGMGVGMCLGAGSTFSKKKDSISSDREKEGE